MSDLQTLSQKLNYDKTFDCVQCGYCLPACPTYETMERETHSPRGRINLVKMVAEGKASVEDLQEPIEKCLGCMACTTVCPTNVQYGEILEGAMGVIDEYEAKSTSQRVTEDFLYDSFFPSSKWMNTLGHATWLYQKSGLQKVAQTFQLTKIAPLHLDQFEKVLPDLPSPKRRKEQRAKRYIRKRPATAKVAFFPGCIMDSVFYESNQKTIELLLRSGAEVVLPEAQTCCGALHAHSGKIDTSIELAKQNIEAFEEEKFDYIVNNAGGCGARLIEYHHLFEKGTRWHERALAFVAKVKDISEVLTGLDELVFNQPLNRTITYQPSCHMTNVQGVTEAPIQLIRKIPGIELKELDRPNFCCGSAGIYNIVNYEDSMDILDVKMKDVCGVNPDGIVTSNPGCLLQMKLGVEREGKSDQIDSIHLVDLLMEAEPEPAWK
ncbi:glycolate oxidase [Halobacillus halophilus]|uniref:Glycolate oxidase iron-sulfur subunit n=1 Tax=Halobacillus halophilus (strain ATCC 35676 / DSM 2266 / JCM 20832 / KCTC 3685 / LMG 17431 / NBRC 102448 / NCIMB 2269) TaxID=866895 RepID=I0JRU5_HALH3|nr:(Fe-S)-binding protein [Halobacillus halophilus]ASF40818.1 glycolate oxidase [Halobacillus halophilus]CCG46866.1 glycolate oxidase iron-sulfur subunit [Halobacillus halophilus DSM 2266]